MKSARKRVELRASAGKRRVMLQRDLGWPQGALRGLGVLLGGSSFTTTSGGLW